MVVPGTGLLLQDRGALFSLDPEHPNRIEGRKRPYHTIIPAMAFKDGRPWLSFGVMGGDLQPQGHVQVLLNMIEFGMNVQEAGEAPRASHSNSGGVGLEKGISPQVAAELMRKGTLGQDLGSHGRLPSDSHRLGTRRAVRRNRSSQGRHRGRLVNVKCKRCSAAQFGPLFEAERVYGPHSELAPPSLRDHQSKAHKQTEANRPHRSNEAIDLLTAQLKGRFVYDHASALRPSAHASPGPSIW